jgi:hypothetical protein
MNLRKLFHISTADQSLIIFNEIKAIQKRISGIANTERKEQTENQKSRDSRCPRCRASITVNDKPNIVDRIASVESKTKIRGNVFKINGIVVVETKPVNHCNNCGHEWEKFRTKVITDFAITKIILDYLSDIIRNPERNKRYSWKHEYMEVFKDCHAEAIHAVQKQYKRALRHPLTVRQLRTKYESIFDKKKSKS